MYVVSDQVRFLSSPNCEEHRMYFDSDPGMHQLEASLDKSNVIDGVNETIDGSGKKQFNSQSVNKENQVHGCVEDNGVWGPEMKILEDC